MNSVIIEVPDMNDSVSSITLQGKQYHLRFTYNDSFNYWKFGIYDALGNPIRSGIKIVPKMVLNLFSGTDKLPNGVFGVLTDLDRIGRDDFKNQKAQFIFGPYQ